MLLRRSPGGSRACSASEQLPCKISGSKEKQRGDVNLALPHYGCASLDKFPNVSEHASSRVILQE